MSNNTTMNQLPKRLTPLQTAINHIKDGRELQTYTREELVSYFSSLLPSEQQLLSEVWDAAGDKVIEEQKYGYELVQAGIAEPQYPNKEQFLSQFKLEA